MALVGVYQAAAWQVLQKLSACRAVGHLTTGLGQFCDLKSEMARPFERSSNSSFDSGRPLSKEVARPFEQSSNSSFDSGRPFPGEMARLDAETSNDLFEVMAQWNTYLNQPHGNDPGPSP